MVYKKFRKSRLNKKDLSSQLNPPNQEAVTLYEDLDQNVEQIKQAFGNSDDLLTRELHIEDLRCSLIYIDGLANVTAINELVESFVFRAGNPGSDIDVDEQLLRITQTAGSIQVIGEFSKVYELLLSGHTAILAEGRTKAYLIGMEGWDRRPISDAVSESVIRGSRESFTETLRVNTMLIRRRIRHPDLRIETLERGKVTKTKISLVYIKGIVNEQVLKELHTRLDKIDIDAILESGYIEQLIEEPNYTPFPTSYVTERPDIVASGMLEGRIAIIVDGSPFVLLIPVLFTQFFQAAEDYYFNFLNSLVRLIRYFAFFIALLAPSLYVAFTTFHPGFIPTTLLINISSQMSQIPFPALVEVLLIATAFEVLREAMLRTPKVVGSAITIVGALVIGQSAIEAGFVTPVMLIVVSVQGMASFILPYSLSTLVRLLRFVILFLTAALGLVGVFVGLMILIIHLCSVKSFGVPYMAPMAPFDAQGQKDTLFRFPLWAMRVRPKFVNLHNRVRGAMNNPWKQTTGGN